MSDMSRPELDPVADRINMARRIEATEALRVAHADLIADMVSAGEEIPASLRDVVDHHLGYDSITRQGELSGVDGEQAFIDVGRDVGDYWTNIGRGEGGFYDKIREEGCGFCGSHTPGCCDGCA